MKKTLLTLLAVSIFCWDGSAQTPCSQIQVSNSMEMGMPINSSMKVANDFIVASGTSNFSVESITANLLSEDDIVSVDLLFYQNNEGVPGTQIGTTITGVIPTSQTVIGTYETMDLQEVVIDLPTPVDFTGGPGTDTTYWVQLVSVPVSGSIVWEMTSLNIIGNTRAYYPTGAPSWLTSPDADGVFTIEGICTPVCADPTALTVVQISDDSADIMWTAGGTETEWEIEYGATGFTPGSGTIITDNDGTLGETITALVPETDYEVYITAICAPENKSEQVGPVTFTTEPLGVADQVFQDFSYHPNPISNLLSLKATNEIQQVVIYDLLGQEVFKTKPNSLSLNFELNGLHGGIYLMKVTVDNSVGFYRIIKE